MLGLFKHLSNCNLTEKIQRLYPNPIIIFLLVTNCAYFNTFYNAQNYYRQGIKLAKNDTLKVDSEFFDKTIEKATAVIVKYPGSRYVDDALFMMGSSYYYKGDYSRAIEKLDFLCLNYPESKFYDDALYYKGLSYYKQDRISSAVIVLKEAMLSKQYRIKSMIALCYVYFKDEKFISLIEVTRDLLKERLSSKEKRWLLHLLGEAQFNQELYTEALKTFNELLTFTHVKEDQRRLKLKIAEIYLKTEEYDRCRDFLEGEEDPEFKNILADLNVKLGNIKRAKEIYLEVGLNSLSEIAAQAFYKLAELYRDEDSLEPAIVYYDSSSNKASMSNYGNRSKKMADVLRRIDDLAKDTVNMDRARFLRAEIYFVDLDEPEKAVVEYQKVYKDFSKSKWAPKALYAQLWITHHILKNDSLTRFLLDALLTRYTNSEYAKSAKNIFVENKTDDKESKD